MFRPRKKYLPTLSILAMLTVIILVNSGSLGSAHSAGHTVKGYGTLIGTVTDSVGKPIANVQIEDSNHTWMGFTDLNGRFSIPLIRIGKYVVYCSHPSFKMRILNDVEVANSNNNKLCVVLSATKEESNSEYDLELQHKMFRTKATDESSAGAMPMSMQSLKLRSGRANVITEHWSPPNFNTEEYSHIISNKFLNVEHNPLSTFSIDVDAASYSNIRRFISRGQMPPIDAVRIEEMINYFNYGYPEPKDSHPFSISTELSYCPWNEENQLVHIGMQGRRIPLADLPPSNLVFLIDVSGSMNNPAKLPLLKASFRLLINQLRPEDMISMVVYAGSAGVVLPPTSGDKKRIILEALSRLQAGGSTAGGAGIRLAYKLAEDDFRAEGNNRIILATDGDFNIGMSSTSEMIRLIEKKRESGVFLTVLGFGTGNLKDSRMEQIADKGNVNYAYIDNINEAARILVNELGSTLLTLARDVKTQIEFNPEHV